MVGCHTCSCSEHKVIESDRFSLFLRSLILIGVGAALHFHFIEHFIVTLIGHKVLILFLGIPFLYTLYVDFLPTISRLWTSSLLPSILPFALCLISPKSVITFLALLIPYHCLDFLLSTPSPVSLIKQASDLIRDPLQYFSFDQMIPSTDVIILFSAVTTMLVSACVAFSSFAMTSELLVSDTFLTLGVYNMSRWFRSGWQNHRLEHNHEQPVNYRSSIGVIQNKLMRQIVRGDMLVFDQPSMHDAVAVPVPVYAHAGTIIIDPQSETQRTLQHDTKLPAHTKVVRGSVECRDSYRDIASNTKFHKRHHAHRAELGTRLYLFAMFSIALLSSALTSYYSGIISAIEQLCMTLMIACPCVYMVIKPAVHARIPAIAESLGFLMNTDNLPLIGQNVTVVFDRTGTLWHPDVRANTHQTSSIPNRDQSKNMDYHDYVISDDVRNMLSDLIHRGIDICILSGHSTHDYQRHRQETVKLLSQLGLKDAENKVVFDASCHGEKSIKSQYIDRIRQYGSLHSPVTIWGKLWGYFQSMIFPRSIIMVGDDLNDQRAMKSADMSIAVGHLRSQLSTTRVQHCNDDGCTNCNSFSRMLSDNSPAQKQPECLDENRVNQLLNSQKNMTQLVYNDHISTYAAFVTSPLHIANMSKLLPILYRSSLCIKMLTGLSICVGVLLMATVCGINPLGLPINPHVVCGLSSSFCLYMTILSRAKIIDYLFGLDIESPKLFENLVNRAIHYIKNSAVFNMFYQFFHPCFSVSGFDHLVSSQYFNLSVNGKYNPVECGRSRVRSVDCCSGASKKKCFK